MHRVKRKKRTIFRAAEVRPNIKVFSARHIGAASAMHFPSRMATAQVAEANSSTLRPPNVRMVMNLEDIRAAQPRRTRLASRCGPRRFRTVSIRVVTGLRLRRSFPKHLARVASNAADEAPRSTRRPGAGEPEVEFRQALRGAHAPMHPPCTCKRTGCDPKREARAVAPKMPWHDVVQSDIAGGVPEGKSYRNRF